MGHNSAGARAVGLAMAKFLAAELAPHDTVINALGVGLVGAIKAVSSQWQSGGVVRRVCGGAGKGWGHIDANV